MTTENQRLLIERRKLNKLKAQNRRLSLQNRKLKAENKDLEKKNRILTRRVRRLRHQRERERSRGESIRPQLEQGLKRYYRYSVAYANKYAKTFRAEVYTNEPKAKRGIEIELTSFLFRKLSQKTRDMNKIRNIRSSLQFVAFEADEIGHNDYNGEIINKMYFIYD